MYLTYTSNFLRLRFIQFHFYRDVEWRFSIDSNYRITDRKSLKESECESLSRTSVFVGASNV